MGEGVPKGGREWVGIQTQRKGGGPKRWGPEGWEQVVWPDLSLAESIGEVATSVPLALPIHRISRMPFRVLLLKSLRMLLPLNVRACRCGRLLDVLGHHRAACSRGVRCRKCWEGGARVSTNVMLRDLDIFSPHSSDGRRLEVVAEGLCLFGGCQLALDATVVSTLHGGGTHRKKADVVALKEARRSKEATYPELCRVIVEHDLWSLLGRSEAGRLKKQRTSCGVWPARSPSLLGCCRGASRRWCSTAKAMACSLVGHRGSPGSGAHEVLTRPGYLV